MGWRREPLAALVGAAVPEGAGVVEPPVGSSEVDAEAQLVFGGEDLVEGQGLF